MSDDTRELRIGNGVPFQWRGKTVVGVASDHGCRGCLATQTDGTVVSTECTSLPDCANRVFMDIEDAITFKLTGQFPTKDDHARS